MIWIFSVFVPTKKLAWKNKKKESPVFWLFLKISNFDLGPFKSKFFKSEKKTINALKKSIYNSNRKSFAQKALFWRTNCYPVHIVHFEVGILPHRYSYNLHRSTLHLNVDSHRQLHTTKSHPYHHLQIIINIITNIKNSNYFYKKKLKLVKVEKKYYILK